MKKILNTLKEVALYVVMFIFAYVILLWPFSEMYDEIGDWTFAMPLFFMIGITLLSYICDKAS